MLLVITTLTFFAVFLFAYILISAFLPEWGQEVALRLRELDRADPAAGTIDEELAKPFSQRVLAPVTGNFADFMLRFTPRSTKRMTEERLAAAGGFGGLSAGQFLVLTGFTASGMAVLGAMAAEAAGLPGNKLVGATILALAVGLVLPFFMLHRKASARKAGMQKDLPDVLDILTVSVEAGLGFDGALVKLSEKMRGALVDEFSRVLQEIRVGVPRREALHAMGRRCGVPDVSLFATSLVQADQLGVSIGNVLRVQAAAVREKRRQRAQERAMKAPIKMLIPLVLFIFPAIFIVLLGPAMIQLVTTFMKR
jgi:Flp pilus assembly protein TadC